MVFRPGKNWGYPVKVLEEKTNKIREKSIFGLGILLP
jgi:hypothetical protein